MLGLNLTPNKSATPTDITPGMKPLSDGTPMGFLAVSDFGQARAFYEGVLGLTVFSQDDYALVLRSGSTLIRLTRPEKLFVAPYTVFGWQVVNIDDKVFSLTAAGITFERYEALGAAQTPHGVWTAPSGDKVAWFKDPDGNLLSLSQH
ncbi:VOC family protein [Asticcacaulis sp. 201]|uniref:VOC family protein n=1 Tax=Asticcacaulis sp. 201 TaxID=3028787 RepID=UPI002915D81E|nr:VOC family protein [Asticcacaulis sp. 201]MDV6329247.1 VOC family protein [Asticcacaulis sp. 201]